MNVEQQTGALLALVAIHEVPDIGQAELLQQDQRPRSVRRGGGVDLEHDSRYISFGAAATRRRTASSRVLSFLAKQKRTTVRMSPLP